MKVDIDSISLMRFLTKIVPCLAFSGLNLSILVLAAKATAQQRPSAYTNIVNLDINYEQCEAKASKAANIVLSRVLSESLVSYDEVTTLIGGTQASTATLVCIKNGQGSIFVVVTNGDAYLGEQEAQSTGDRLVQLMSGDL